MYIDDMFKLNFTHIGIESQRTYELDIKMLTINEMCDRNEDGG